MLRFLSLLFHHDITSSISCFGVDDGIFKKRRFGPILFDPRRRRYRAFSSYTGATLSCLPACFHADSGENFGALRALAFDYHEILCTSPPAGCSRHADIGSADFTAAMLIYWGRAHNDARRGDGRYEFA